MSTKAWAIHLGAAAAATVVSLLTPLPQCLALTHGLYHIAVWHSLYLGHTPVISDLSDACADAACSFRNGLISLGLDDAEELGEELIAELRRGNYLISSDGARSMRSPGLPPPLEIGIRLILVEDRPRARQAAEHLDALGQVVLERAYPYQVQDAFYSSGLTTTEAIDEILISCGDLVGKMTSMWDEELNWLTPAEACRTPALKSRHDGVDFRASQSTCGRLAAIGGGATDSKIQPVSNGAAQGRLELSWKTHTVK